MCECERVFYAPVNMTLRRKMDYPVNVVLLHQRLHRFIIADVCLYKRIILLTLYVLQVCQIPCIRQLVKVDDAVFGVLVYEQAYHMRAYETGSARYDDVSLVFHDSCVVNPLIKTCFAIHGLLPSKTWPFATQFAVFCKAFLKSLIFNALRKWIQLTLSMRPCSSCKSPASPSNKGFSARKSP